MSPGWLFRIACKPLKKDHPNQAIIVNKKAFYALGVFSTTGSFLTRK
jgi:hypothetical protein